ncbi:uncharacterized protein ASPGLDRAFT_42871 [Aspergillus glaucus CBS 516.65]|uniref:Secreted protein n=1 Tax=Aspergillus glaucus CBS 516.65 TaxID=1160497 RepID=A0A1L9VV64_ASPGL|nr:hypothetical protein ASPGLDRAFT_42871 [Aspergillus glaucus CBS 516.65]OJJ87803.1 hypothetical protein ASPGLDRAFT_42871 [Aspergillus glaucus CBS 516.65]
MLLFLLPLLLLLFGLTLAMLPCELRQPAGYRRFICLSYRRPRMIDNATCSPFRQHQQPQHNNPDFDIDFNLDHL